VEVADLLGYCAAAASLVAFSAKTMIPLRIAAIVSNVLFISYGLAGGHGPPIVLHSILLPLNVHRLVAMQKLVRRVRAASTTDDFRAAWLQPYMKRKSFSAGDIIFCRGDVAHDAYYLVSGRIRFPEIERTVEGGMLFGEIAIFTPGGTRTLSCLCETDVEVLFITNDELKQLYFQNPEFGYHLVRLIVGRLVGQVEELERRRLRVVTPVARDAGEARRDAEVHQLRSDEAAARH
jgi:CRP-like cAMP-binding protein